MYLDILLLLREGVNEAYEQAVKDNELIVGYALGYQQTQDINYLRGMHELLVPTSRSVINRIIREANLALDLEPDMLQDAYLRLADAVSCYDWYKTPVFITYWRVTLRNHLIDLYRKQWRLRQLPEDYDTKAPEDHDGSSFMLTELEHEIREVIATATANWKSQKHLALAETILKERILKPKDEQTTHKVIAAKFQFHPGAISQWEVWMRDLIKQHLLTKGF